MKTMMNAPVHANAWAHRVYLGLGALGVAAVFLAAPAAADPADPVPPTVVPTDPSTQLTSVDPSAPLTPVQHLSSPDNLPPGTTDVPPQGRLSYLRDLLHAIRTQEVSGSDALLLLTQRPLDANATPPPGMSAGPSGPVGTSAVPPPADAG